MRTDAEKKAIEKLRQQQPGFGAFRAARAAEEKRRQEEEKAKRIVNPEIGDLMPDGTIYAGISPKTGTRMFVTAEDAPLQMNFNESAQYARKLSAHGHRDWRVPTKAEMNVLFKNRERGSLKETFNLTGHGAGWYGTAALKKETPWVMRFLDGFWDFSRIVGRQCPASIRCVRRAPAPK